MAVIDYERFAVVLRRCAEIAVGSVGAPIATAYSSGLKAPAEAFLTVYDEAALAERSFERSNKALVDAMAALEPSYVAALATVKKHVPTAALPESLAKLSSLFDRALAVEALLNILDDSVVEDTWAVKEIMTPFGEGAPQVLFDLGEAVLSSPTLGPLCEARAKAYAPAFERHRVFKRVVRQVFGPQSGQYQSIHWRSAWGTEGAGPVSWGPFSFRAPFRTW